MKRMFLAATGFLAALVSTPVGFAAVDERPDLHGFTMKTIDGADQPLSAYRGKALLIVNTASQCGYI